MKLKTPLIFGLSLCMTFGICFSAAACDENDTPNKEHTDHVDKDNDGLCDECGKTLEDDRDDPTVPEKSYSVTIEVEKASVLNNMSVLFYSKNGTSELKELRGSVGVSADLPDDTYTAYLVGNMPGYTMTPVELTPTSKSGKIKVEPVKPIQVPEEGDFGPTGNMVDNIYYQVLVLLPDGKTVYFGAHPDMPEANSVQICTYSEGGAGMCYNAYVDEKTGLAWHNGDEGDLRDWAFFPKQKHQVHFSIEEEWPEGCKFDDEKYILSEEGGFFTVMFDKA